MGSIPIGSASAPPASPAGRELLMLPSPSPAGLWPRLAAGAYDALVVAGILMLTSLAVIAARDGAAVPSGSLGYQAFIVLQVAAYFTAFWSRGGQTVGMRAWRLRVETVDGRPLAVTGALLRFLATLVAVAPLCAGIAWIVVDRERRGWHDRLARTRVVRLPKPARG